jgi:pilus assembly protein Flp/PilA
MRRKTLFAKFAADQRGATAIEYGLILALICIAIVGAATVLGGNTGASLQNAADQFPS